MEIQSCVPCSYVHIAWLEILARSLLYLTFIGACHLFAAQIIRRLCYSSPYSTLRLLKRTSIFSNESQLDDASTLISIDYMFMLLFEFQDSTGRLDLAPFHIWYFICVNFNFQIVGR